MSNGREINDIIFRINAVFKDEDDPNDRASAMLYIICVMAKMDAVEKEEMAQYIYKGFINAWENLERLKDFGALGKEK